MDFSKYTLREIDELDLKVIKNLEFVDFASYVKRNEELGRPYKINGITKHPSTDEIYYGNGAKSLTKNLNGEWEIGVWASGPVFKENPVCIDEKTFVKTMVELGISQEKIDEFIAYEIDWNDF